jgi:hypothetical protein
MEHQQTLKLTTIELDFSNTLVLLLFLESNTT